MKTQDFAHFFIESPIADGILFERTADGLFMTNVPLLHSTGGSPSGFETGYMGSGPSAFSLNAVDWILHEYHPEKPSSLVQIKSGDLDARTHHLYHAWKTVVTAYVKIEAGDRYVMPINLACRAVEVASVNMDDDPPLEFDWTKIPGGTENEIQMALLEFKTRFLSSK